jgi:hypothetical protein
MLLAIVVVILKKKIGAVPRNSPIVVKPNAKPGDVLSTDTNKAKVIDIVILNNATPIRDIIII